MLISATVYCDGLISQVGFFAMRVQNRIFKDPCETRGGTGNHARVHRMSALTRLFLFWAKKHSHPDVVLPVKKTKQQIANGSPSNLAWSH